MVIDFRGDILENVSTHRYVAWRGVKADSAT
jgi:hypothetical protein